MKKKKKTMFEKLPTLVMVSIMISLLVWVTRDRTEECLLKCFIKDGETWCPSECWDTFEKNEIIPNPIITECEMWGFGYGCEEI